MTNEETFLASLDKAMEKLIYETVLFGRQHPHQGTARYGGGVPKRQGTVFLISLKAGGLGLNLTGANYVIHLDPWWNPAIEQQATDRAYRIGQNQKVTVYHLIAEIPLRRRFCVCTKPNSCWRTRCSKERICRTNSPRKTSWNCWRKYNDCPGTQAFTGDAGVSPAVEMPGCVPVYPDLSGTRRG